MHFYQMNKDAIIINKEIILLIGDDTDVFVISVRILPVYFGGEGFKFIIFKKHEQARRKTWHFFFNLTVLHPSNTL